MGNHMIEVYEVENGRWVYKVERVIQEWHPEKDGNVPMTEEEANYFSSVIYERMFGSPEMP